LGLAAADIESPNGLEVGYLGRLGTCRLGLFRQVVFVDLVLFVYPELLCRADGLPFTAGASLAGLPILLAAGSILLAGGRILLAGGPISLAGCRLRSRGRDGGCSSGGFQSRTW